MSQYPGNLDVIHTDKADLTPTTVDHPGHHNLIADAVNKIEAELGTNPKGTFPDVRRRLESGSLTARIASYVIYYDGTQYQAISPIGLTAPAPSADAAAVVQSCLDLISSSTTPRGSIVLAPNTNFVWNSVPMIRRTYAAGGTDDNKWLKIFGSGGSVIQITASGPRVFDFNKVADHDTYSGIELGHFTIDGNQVGGLHHVLLGNWQNGSYQDRLNLERVYLHDISAVNIKTDFANTATNHRLFVWFQNVHTATLEATQNWITDFRMHNVFVKGGHILCGLGGYDRVGNTVVNTWTDKIDLQDCDFDTGTIPAQFASVNGTQLGIKGFCGRLYMRNVNIHNVADSGHEVNGWMEALVEDCFVEDAYSCCFLNVNFNYPSVAKGVAGTVNMVPRQRIVYENCVGRRRQITDTTIQYPGAFYFSNLTGGTYATWGTVKLNNCKVDWDFGNRVSSAITVNDQKSNAIGFNVGTGAGPAFHRFEVNGFELLVSNATWNNASSLNFRPIAFELDSTFETTLRIRDVTVRFSNCAQGGAGVFFTMPLSLYSGKANAYVEGIDASGTITGQGAGGAMNVVEVGATSLTVTRAEFRNISIQRYTGDTSPVPVWVKSTTNLTISRELRLVDLYNGVGATSATIDATQVAKVTRREVSTTGWPPGETTFTPGATGVGAQYTGGFPGLMTITGGTVTLVEVSTDGVTYRSVAAGTNTSFFIDQGQFVRITYTVAPTCRVIRML